MSDELAVRRHWIPPGGLLTGFAAHGLSWIVLFFIAVRRLLTIDFPALAWVHLVALGWLTMIALSVLIHVIPTFTDVPWKGELLARRALAVYAPGVAALVAAFWWRAFPVLPWAATLVGVGLGCYLLAALRTLAAGYARPRVEAAIARALSATLTSLFVTAALGIALAWMLAGRLSPAPSVSGPPIHATFGTIGWLTVLVMGVSTRTVRPITGARSRNAFAHAAAGSAEIVGLIVTAAGLALGWLSIAWAGAITVAAGALLYVGDLVDVLRRASERHRPPQAFLWAGSVWFLTGLALALYALAGGGSGVAAVYVLLAGWIGQMVNGHLYHIGVRLIATMARGDDDETSPGELLKEPLSWISFSFFQTAIMLGGLGLFLENSPLLEAAACTGFAGWLAMLVNIMGARMRAIA
jgi:hypothetical protein